LLPQDLGWLALLPLVSLGLLDLSLPVGLLALVSLDLPGLDPQGLLGLRLSLLPALLALLDLGLLDLSGQRAYPLERILAQVLLLMGYITGGLKCLLLHHMALVARRGKNLHRETYEVALEEVY
jgi:hypothetical protein